MTDYTSTVKIEWGGNRLEAESIGDYKDKVKALFLEEFNISDLRDEEITEIEEVTDDNNS